MTPSIERAGRLSGQRFLGGQDWYRVGCEYLVSTQRRDGSWQGGGRRNLAAPISVLMEECLPL